MISDTAAVLPLGLVPAGRKAVIKEIIGGEGLRRRLIEMGFNRGATIRVIANEHGPLIVALEGSRMVLGQGMAQKVIVQEA
ncbi:MAG: FeoA domain-containing protein [Tepidanaerobacteraceae bacterium]|jgi:ferrous iron transport protein A|nr:FeoA domain-containing protein [Tepidanaerobacteraceae bacterium]